MPAINFRCFERPSASLSGEKFGIAAGAIPLQLPAARRQPSESDSFKPGNKGIASLPRSTAISLPVDISWSVHLRHTFT
ncbi:hypothetical protein MVEN_00331200 [Mycena venus]|uniref:Uncharacterized protein n=1 Tax=Mycena venus TaxID=2733690 RepID=A0A8H6YP07_9AGAR|nr:hypothetical protein MVEN_00331200 [Mycena venus]